MTTELCRFRHPVRGAMVIWELTRYCNLACVHCCTDSNPQISTERDLALPEIRRAIDEMLAVGVVEFFFSGGEPMSRPDFPEIIEAVDPERADAFVNTNGYHLTPALAQRLAGTALRRVTISIDGADRATHALLRSKAASYDRAIDAVRAALGAGLAVRVSHVVAAPNVASIEEFVSRMIEVGVDNIVVNTVFPAGRAARNPHLHLTHEQVADVERRLVALREYCRKRGVELDFSMGEPDKDDVPIGCPAGNQVLYVAPDGSVSGCSWLAKLDPARFTVGNLHRTSFAAMSGGLAGQNLLFSEHRSCPLPRLAERR